MEDHPKHDKKKNKNSKTMGMGMAINIGGASGSVGMGGIVLFGGALVTATIVLALKARWSSKKSRSASPETHTDQSEFTVKSNKDVSVDSQNQSVGASSINGVPNSRSIQDLSREEKQKTDEEVESGIAIMFSVTGEDEEMYDDSVFESNRIVAEMGFPIVEVGEEDKKYCNENNQQSHIGTQQSSAPIEATEVEFESMQVAVGEEHKKYGNENNQQCNTDTQQSSAPIEATEVEFESMQVAVGDDKVSDEEEMPTTGHVVEETAVAVEAACLNQEVKLKLVQFNQDCEDEMSVADCQGELTSSYETGYAGDGIVSEAIDTVCVGVEKEVKGECDGEEEGEGGDLTDEIAMGEEYQQTRNKLVVVRGLAGDDETTTEEDQESRTFSNDEPATVREDNPSPPHETEIQHVQNKKTPEAETMITEGETGENEENDEMLIPPHALSDVTTAKAQVSLDGNGVENWPDASMQQVEEADESSHEIQESMEGDETILLGNGHKDSKPYKEMFCKETQGAFLKHCCYSELLHFSEISLVATLLLILISLAIGTALQRYLLK